MKKLLIFGMLAIVLLGGAGGGGYYLYQLKYQSDDHSIIVVDSVYGQPVPPPFSITGKTLAVPNMVGVTTTMNLLFPTSRRDFPMGRFTSMDGTIKGRLVVYDEFVSPYTSNHRAVPISVNTGGAEELYYLAILEGDEMRHAISVPIGDRIKITGLARQGDDVTLSYFVHDKNQSLDDVPTVGTSAIVNVATGLLVQAGRDPQTEVTVADKFTGTYYWVATTYADGKVVKPDSLEYFTLGFSGNNITLGTDCNTGGATLTLGAGSSTVFTVGVIDATKKTCGSQYETEYFTMFGKVVSYRQSSNGKLMLTFTDGGTMQFIAEAEKNAVLHPATASSTPAAAPTSTNT